MKYFAQAIINPIFGSPDLLILDCHDGNYGREPGNIIDRISLEPFSITDIDYDIDKALQTLGYRLVNNWEIANLGLTAIVKSKDDDE